jgi:hypothetical protein
MLVCMCVGHRSAVVWWSGGAVEQPGCSRVVICQLLLYKVMLQYVRVMGDVCVRGIAAAYTF